jgi:alpha-methylacyl-CoA racemase
MSSIYGMKAGGQWSGLRGENLVDGGAPFYNVYETADGRYVSVGALEPAHYVTLLTLCGLDAASMPAQHDATSWPETRSALTAVFRSRTCEEWVEVFAGSDASFAPVLSMDTAPGHEYHRQRGTFPAIDGVVQPAPAPRFSRTPSRAGRIPTEAAEDLMAVGRGE